MDTLWIVCACYHDVEAFLALRAAVAAEIGRLDVGAPRRLRFVVIDDSGDQDPELTRLDEFDDVDLLHVPFNLGNQRAIVFGLRVMAPEIDADDRVITMDADGEDRPADVPRLLRALHDLPAGADHVVLAWRLKRREPWWFRLLYLGYRLMFRLLTGTVIRTGNFAAFRGILTRRVLFHPYFDLSYASALLSLNIPATFVPCDRGRRYSGRSKMTFPALLRHGLRMLMPFIDRIAARALVLFTVVFVAGLAAAGLILSIKLFTSWAIPGWTSSMLLLILTISVTALGNFLILFVLFAQSESLSMRGLHEQRLGSAADAARGAPPRAGPSGDGSVLAPPAMARRRDGPAGPGPI